MRKVHLKITALLLSVIVLTSCSTKLIPFKNTYPTTPIIVQTTSSFDQVWDKLIDVFAQNGLSIKLIDRSSGLILSGKAVIPASYEYTNGNLVEPNAFISIITYKANGRIAPFYLATIGPYASDDQIKNIKVYGEWNVRVKKLETGGCSINVNLTSVTYDSYNSSLKYNVEKSMDKAQYRSTGVFENLISEKIK